MLLSDEQITNLCNTETPMITPFYPEKIRLINGVKVPSFGLSHTGYDLSLGNEFFVPTGELFDARNPDIMTYDMLYQESYIIPPNQMVLARSVETFNMPSDVMAICVGKSSYARMGIIANITPLEVSWRGVLTLELSNTSGVPVKIYSGDGIAQLLFIRVLQPLTTYSGKYQDQSALTTAKV